VADERVLHGGRKTPPGTAIGQYRQMMANLLAERFGLVSHRVVKDFAGYEITVAKAVQS